jgi:hypothetical protein
MSEAVIGSVRSLVTDVMDARFQTRPEAPYSTKSG